MTTGLQNTWSKTAASNGAADGNVNFAEGQAPSSLNDSCRAVMAAIAKFVADTSGVLVTAGIATAYTLTTNEGLTLKDGLTVTARMHGTSGVAPTLNVDGTGAKNIQYGIGAVASAALVEAGIYSFTYDAADQVWLLRLAASDPTVGAQVGMEFDYHGTSAPAGYVRANGLTIGNASSNATERANADTANLYSLLWSAYSNTVLPIQDSTGSASTRGMTAAADYAANKRLPLPDKRGRVSAGLDDMGNSAAGRLGTVITTPTVPGSVGGTETVALATANLPAHTHTGTTGAESATHTHPYTGTATSITGGIGAGAQQFPITAQTNNTSTESATHTHSFTTDSTGSGTAHSNMQPTWINLKIIKL